MIIFFTIDIDSGLNICHAAITYFNNYFCWILSNIYGCLKNAFELKKGIFTDVVGDVLWKSPIESDVLRFLEDLLLFSFSLFGGLHLRFSSYPGWFKIFW